VYFITLHLLVRKIFTFYIIDVLLFKYQFQGQRVNSSKSQQYMVLVYIQITLNFIVIQYFPFVFSVLKMHFNIIFQLKRM